MPAHSDTNPGGYRRQPTLAEFLAAWSADELCKTAMRHLGQATTEFTSNKEGVLFRGNPIGGAVWKLVAEPLRQCLFNLTLYHPLLVTLDSFIFLTPRKETLTGLKWLLMCINSWWDVTVVPKTALHLSTSPTNNSPRKRTLINCRHAYLWFVIRDSKRKLVRRYHWQVLKTGSSRAYCKNYNNYCGVYIILSMDSFVR